MALYHKNYHTQATPNPSKSATRRFMDLAGPDLNIHDYTDSKGYCYLLVSDGATRYWVDSEDITHAAIDQYHADRAAVENLDSDCLDDLDQAQYTRGNAYTNLCQAIPGLHDDFVPAEILEQAREDYEVDYDDSIAWGF